MFAKLKAVDFPRSQKPLGLHRISKFPESPKSCPTGINLNCPVVKISIATSFTLDRSSQRPPDHNLLLHTAERD